MTRTDSLVYVYRSGTSSVPSFYHPPAISELWRDYYSRVNELDEALITKRLVLNLLDTLAASVQADFDSLIERAQAFEGSERGYTHRFFRSPLTRDQILADPISREEAAEIPHFHAVYDPQGYLVRVRYVEPRKWRTRQMLLAEGFYTLSSSSAETPQVRYFLDWNLYHFEPSDYIKKKKIAAGQPYFRGIYRDDDELQSIQAFGGDGRPSYTITHGKLNEAGESFTEVIFADGTGSLLSLHPYLFLREWSRVKPQWRVALTRDENGQLRSAQVFNDQNQIVYYYTFTPDINETEQHLTLQVSILSDREKVLKVFALVFDRADRLISRSSYTTKGQLVSTTTYDYESQNPDVVATTRNPVGVIIAQEVLRSLQVGN